MVDPVAAGVGKAVQSAAEGLSKAAGELLIRMFGPASDQIGAYLEQKAYYRFNNAERIAQNAEKKAKRVGREEGSVPPRLAYTMLEEGTYSDDELMAEYLGGVLAAGRTPSGRDDRGVSWTKIITSMSVPQLRLHFVLYREWCIALKGSQRSLDEPDGRDGAHMYVELTDLGAILATAIPDIPVDSMFSHVFGGLSRMRMLEGMCAWGSVQELGRYEAVASGMPFDTAAVVGPSPVGMELFGWACGLPGLTPAEFPNVDDSVLPLDAELPRPRVFFGHGAF